MANCEDIQPDPASDDQIVVGPLAVTAWAGYKRLRLEALEMEPQAFGSTWRSMNEKPDSYWQDRLQVAAIGDQPLMLFAQRRQTVPGMIGAFLAQPGSAFIISMYVTPGERQKGIGKMLVQAMLERIQADPAVRMARLTVNSEQKAAVALYSSCGFKVVNSESNPMGDGKVYVEWVMEYVIQD